MQSLLFEAVDLHLSFHTRTARVISAGIDWTPAKVKGRILFLG
jgi:hypothetical protein